MTTRFATLVLSGICAGASPVFALESLNEDSMDVVTAGGIAHLLETSPLPATPGRPEQPRVVGLMIDEHLTRPNMDNRINQGISNDNVLVTSRQRSNDVSATKVADINIQFDETKDKSSSTYEGETLRLNLAMEVDSIAAINTRHHPDEIGSRGSYYLNQLQVNSNVIINGR